VGRARQPHTTAADGSHYQIRPRPTNQLRAPCPCDGVPGRVHRVAHGRSRCAAAPRGTGTFPCSGRTNAFSCTGKRQGNQSIATRPVFPGALLPGQRHVTLRHAHTSTGTSWCGPTCRRAETASLLPSSTRYLQLARRKRRKPPFTFGSNSSLATLPGRIRETRQQRQVMGARRKSHQLSLWSLAWCPSPRPCRRGTGAGHAPLCCAGTVPPDPAETATDTYATRNNHTKQKRRHKAVARAAVSGEGTEQTPPPRGLPRKGRMPRLLRTAVLGTGGRWRRGVGGGVGRAASPGGQAH
jgi:hypothetical protein